MSEKSELQLRFEREQKNYELLKLRCFPRMLAIREMVNSHCMDKVREKSKFTAVRYDFLQRMLNSHDKHAVEEFDEIIDCVRHYEYAKQDVREYELLLNEVNCAHKQIDAILHELNYPYVREYMDSLASEIPI